MTAQETIRKLLSKPVPEAIREEWGEKYGLQLQEGDVFMDAMRIRAKDLAKYSEQHKELYQQYFERG